MTTDFLPIQGTDYIEFYVGNSKQASLFYQHCMGFEVIAYGGPETGIRDLASESQNRGRSRSIRESEQANIIY